MTALKAKRKKKVIRNEMQTLKYNSVESKNKIKIQGSISHSVSLQCSAGVHTPIFPWRITFSLGLSSVFWIRLTSLTGVGVGRQVIPPNQNVVCSRPQSLAQGLVRDPVRVNAMQDSWQGFLRETCVCCPEEPNLGEYSSDSQKEQELS